MALKNEDKLYALLLTHAGEISKRELLDCLSVGPEELPSIIESLRNTLREGVLELLESETSISLVFTEEAQAFIEEGKSAPEREITQAGAEVISALLYRGALSKGEIDELRGVDSRFSLGNLLERGYVERTSDKKYALTTEALETLGLKRAEDAPDYEEIKRALQGGEEV
jgi:chromosome segregation and condensation protein ScpB